MTDCVFCGRAVPHLHFHVPGARRMGWPPG